MIQPQLFHGHQAVLMPDGFALSSDDLMEVLFLRCLHCHVVPKEIAPRHWLRFTKPLSGTSFVATIPESYGAIEYVGLCADCYGISDPPVKVCRRER